MHDLGLGMQGQIWKGKELSTQSIGGGGGGILRLRGHEWYGGVGTTFTLRVVFRDGGIKANVTCNIFTR